MGNIKKHCILGSTDHIGKYEVTNYCSMCDNQSASVKKYTCFWNWTIAVLHWCKRTSLWTLL